MLQQGPIILTQLCSCSVGLGPLQCRRRPIRGREVYASFLGCRTPGTCLSKAQILEAAEGSLRRLGVSYIDLLQLHWPQRYVPLQDTGDARDVLFDIPVRGKGDRPSMVPRPLWCLCSFLPANCCLLASSACPSLPPFSWCPCLAFASYLHPSSVFFLSPYSRVSRRWTSTFMIPSVSLSVSSLGACRRPRRGNLRPSVALWRSNWTPSTSY